MAALGDTDGSYLVRSWSRSRMVKFSLPLSGTTLLAQKPDRHLLPDMWIYTRSIVFFKRAHPASLAV